MKIYEMEAIRVPKEDCGLTEDVYMLLLYAGHGDCYLPNGRRIDSRKWLSPGHQLEGIFFTKEEFFEAITENTSFPTCSPYKDEGYLKLERFEKIANDAFDSAKTVEELGGIHVVRGTLFRTSQMFYSFCMESFEEEPILFNRNDLNVTEDYIEYAIQPFYAIKLGNGTWLGQGYQSKSLSILKAKQFKSEQDALDSINEKDDFLGAYGFEIIRIEGVDRDETRNLLKFVGQN